MNRQRLGEFSAVLVWVRISYSQRIFGGTLNSVVFLLMSCLMTTGSEATGLDYNFTKEFEMPSICLVMLLARFSKMSWSVRVCAVSEKR